MEKEPGLGNIFKQAFALQKNLKKIQDELERTEVTGVSGGEAVKIVLNCQYGVKSVFIALESMQEEKAILEELIAAVMNDATRKVDKMKREKLSGLGIGADILNAK